MRDKNSVQNETLAKLQATAGELRQENAGDWREVPCYSRSRQSVSGPNYQIMPEKMVS